MTRMRTKTTDLCYEGKEPSATPAPLPHSLEADRWRGRPKKSYTTHQDSRFLAKSRTHAVMAVPQPSYLEGWHPTLTTAALSCE